MGDRVYIQKYITLVLQIHYITIALMMIRYLPFFLSLFTLSNLNAQSPPSMAAEGNVWAHEDYIHPTQNRDDIYTTYYFTKGEILIEGQVYRKVYTTSNLNPGDTTFHLGIRQVGDSVLVHGPTGGERLTYRFDVEVGDTVQVAAALGEEFYHIVSGIDSMEMLDGTYRKRIYIDLYLYFQGEFEGHFSEREIWVEGIGALRGAPLWEPKWTGWHVFEFLADTLYCFSDSTGSIYVDETYQSCDVLITDVAEISKKKPVKIYPNPATDVLNIEITSPELRFGKISIWNLQGTLMVRSPPQGLTELDVSLWPKGVYLVQVDLPDKAFTQLVIKTD